MAAQCTADPPSSNKKRKASDSTESLGLQPSSPFPSNATSELPSESSVNGAASGPFSNPLIDQATNKWTKDTLDKLNIVTTTTSLHTPMQLISRAYKNINHDFSVEMEQKIKVFKEHILVRSPLHRLNVNALEEVDTEFAYQIRSYMNRFLVDDPWNKAVEEKGNDFRLWHKFHAYGEQFAQQLVHYSMKQRDVAITEAMYQCLFENFVKMFGLCCLTTPQQEFKMQIGENKVTSIPDVVFPCAVSTNSEEVDIIAICEAKQKYKKEDELSPRNTRPTKKQKARIINHIDDMLLGQLGGELLTSLPFSKNQRGLLGVILQEIFVTFCHFDCTLEQYEDIKRRKADISVKPEICFSKPYNYLNAADREDLTEPLLKLGLIQYMPLK